MSDGALKILHVEDDFADAILVQNAVCEAGDFDIEFEVVRTLKEAKRKLANGEYDLILLDLRLPDSVHPSETLEVTRSNCGDTPLLVLSGSTSVDNTHLPEDVARLDKNESFASPDGKPPVHLAGLIRDAAQSGDVMTI